MRHAMALAFVFPFLAGTAWCHAQTATIDVVHDDADGVVTPGESIRVLAHLSRTPSPVGPLSQTFLARVAGDLAASGDLGQASGVTSPFLPQPPHCQTTPGTIVGGTLTGFQVRFPTPPDFVAGPWGFHWTSSSIDLVSFEWTAPFVVEPTSIIFEWRPAVAYPLVQIYDPVQFIPVINIPTTYHSTSILVLPTPATLTLFGVVGAVLPDRRRRA